VRRTCSLLTAEQGADRLGMSVYTLRDLRRRGGGPEFLRFARFSADSGLLGRSLRLGFD
jgi:hypothetical protein